MNKKELTKLVDRCYREAGPRETVAFLDDIKEIGFKYATKSGLSICIGDMHIPTKKAEIIDKANKEILEVEQQYAEGLITKGERYNKVIDIWAHVTEMVTAEMMRELGAAAETGVPSILSL